MSDVDKTINRLYKMYDNVKSLRHNIVYYSTPQQENEINNKLSIMYPILKSYGDTINKMNNDLTNKPQFPYLQSTNIKKSPVATIKDCDEPCCKDT